MKKLLFFIFLAGVNFTSTSQGVSMHSSKENQIKVYEAASSGNLDTVKDMVLSGVDINALYEDSTALITAVSNKDAQAVKILMLAGADIYAKNESGHRAWDYISDNKTRKTVKETFKEMAFGQKVLDEKFEEFFKAAAESGSGCLDEMITLIYAGANTKRVFMPEEKTALLYVFTNKYWGFGNMASPEFIEAILKAGVEVNLQDNDGQTALMYEVYDNKGSLSVKAADRLKVLLKYGADTEIKDKNNMTALTIARIYYGYEGLISNSLVKAGAKRNLTQEWWLNLNMYWADSYKFCRDIEFLIKDGANINSTAKYNVHTNSAGGDIEGNGQTALMFMAGRLQQAQIIKLIELGANPTIKDDTGKTALHYVAAAKSLLNNSDEQEQKYLLRSIFDILKHAGADVDSKDNDGKTTFDYALSSQPYLAIVIYEQSGDIQKNKMAVEVFNACANKHEKKVIKEFVKSAGKIKYKNKPKEADVFPQNEIWTLSDQRHYFSGESYMFLPDGRFIKNEYYSGGIYWNMTAFGEYTYDESLKEITLDVKNVSGSGHGSTHRAKESNIGSKIKISDISDNSVSIAGVNTYTREKIHNGLIWQNKFIPVSDISLHININEKPVSFANVKIDDFETILNVLNVPADEQSNMKIKIKDVPEILISIIGSFSFSKQIKIYPSLGLMYYDGAVYKIDDEEEKIKKFIKLMASYIKDVQL